FKEGGHGGEGPHGMLTGITGSGKSKLLRAFVLLLAMLHAPEMLQMLLGDFKGEAEFANLAGLPHVVGVVSDLEKSRARLDRFKDVLMGELAIRKKSVNDVTVNGVKLDSLHDYELARATIRPDLAPIGSLIIILDEFSELLRIREDMAKVFDYVGRQGRAYGVHIFNASQRAEVAKMQGLMAQQTFAIGMKVKDPGESRAAIGSSRCYEDITLKKLPPGWAFKVVDGEHTKFRSWFTKAPFVPPRPTQSRVQVEGTLIDAHRFTAEVTPLPDDVVELDVAAPVEQVVPTPGVDAPTVESVLVGQIVKYGKDRPIRPMWLPPLDDLHEIPIDAMCAEFWGRAWDKLDTDNGLVVPYAREDDPLRHTQDLVSLDLSGAQGNVLITGATGTGKSTAAATLVMMLAVSHSPQRVQVYGIDFGGGKLGRLSGLAHVCGIAGRGDDQKIGRVIAEVERIVRFRTRHWAGLGVEEFRARKFGDASGSVPEDGHGDVFLIVDNVRAVKDEALSLHDRIKTLAEGALNYGVHLILTSDSWMMVDPTLMGKCGSTIELRLDEANNSKAVNKQVARDVPNQPGRGLLRNANHTLVGVPYFSRSEGSEQQATENTVRAVSGLWTKVRDVAAAPPLAVLPADIAYTDLVPTAGVLTLGIGESEMATVGVNLHEAPHFYAVGSSKSGRTTVLRTLLRAIQDSYAPPDPACPGPHQAQVVLFDGPGYELVKAIDKRYLAEYAANAQDIERVSEQLALMLAQQRTAPAGMAPEELATWRPGGPTWFVVVDDLNLLSAPGTSQTALMALVDGIRKGRQVNMHVLAATNVESWYATGRMNRVITAMDTAGAGVLIMDGSPAEQVIDKVRAAHRPPGRGELYYRKGGGQLMQVAVCADNPPAK
ncbi:MAG: type VII secretion protein EccCb, partial [Mycolicibacterium sp.]|nr:type VII secretion protein EccCb [Mycolicibacterium sp.]